MKYHKGFIAPLLLILAAVLLFGGGAYMFTQNKQESQQLSAQATSTTQAGPRVPEIATIRVTSPAGGETWRNGDTVRLAWTSNIDAFPIQEYGPYKRGEVTPTYYIQLRGISTNTSGGSIVSTTEKYLDWKVGNITEHEQYGPNTERKTILPGEYKIVVFFVDTYAFFKDSKGVRYEVAAESLPFTVK